MREERMVESGSDSHFQNSQKVLLRVSHVAFKIGSRANCNNVREHSVFMLAKSQCYRSLMCGGKPVLHVDEFVEKFRLQRLLASELDSGLLVIRDPGSAGHSRF